ncbi:MAG: hypothetical protein ACK484_09915, partial [Sphingobacteriales bacterium]
LSYPNDELTPVLKHCIIRTHKQNDLCAAVGTNLVSTTDIELIPAIAGYPNGELHHCGMNKISYA